MLKEAMGMMRNKIKKLKKNNEGMITVEVSVIVPIITFIIAGVVFMLLFFLDVAAAKSESMRIADEVAVSWKNEGDLITGRSDTSRLLSRDLYFLTKNKRESLTGQAEKRLSTRINERSSITKLEKASVSIKAKRANVQVNLSFRWPLKGIEKYMGNLLSFSCSSAAPVDNWQELLRMEGGLAWK